MPAGRMVYTPTDPSKAVCCERIVAVFRQREAFSCVLANRVRILLPLLLANHIAAGDEVAFPVPARDGVESEIYATKASSSLRNCLYLAPIRYATQPRLDKREHSFVSAQVQGGSFGICSVFLPCETLRDYFYGIPNPKSGSESGTLYEILHIGTSASTAEIRVAFKLRDLELKTSRSPHAEQTALERAFNILGQPELRACYDALLADQDTVDSGHFSSLANAPGMPRRSSPGDNPGIQITRPRISACTSLSAVRLGTAVTAAIFAIRVKTITVPVFPRRTHPFSPVLRDCPVRKCGYSLWLLVLIEIYPGALKFIKISTQSETGTCPFEGLHVGRCHPIFIR